MQNLGGAKYTIAADTQPFTKGMQQVQQEAQHAGRGILQLGYAIDDLQYGFRGIANNIPQIALGLGFGAGIAGAAAVAATAVNQLVNHWGELTSMMQAAWSGSTVEQLEKIRKGAEDAAKAFDELAAKPTKAQAAQQKDIGEAIVEGPIAKVMEGVLHGVANDPTLKADELEALNRGIKESIMHPFSKRVSLEDAKEKINKEKAEQIIGGAQKGDPQALATLRKLVKANPGGFPDEFLQDLDNSTPEGKERIQQKRFEAQRSRNLRKQDDKDKEKDDKLVDDLNQQGRDATEEMMKMKDREAKEQEREDRRARQEQQREAEKTMSRAEKLEKIGNRPFEPAGQHSGFMGAAQFSQSIQTGALNNDAAFRKAELDKLDKIAEIMKEFKDDVARNKAQALFVK